MLMTFKLLDYPLNRACCLSAMTYRSLFLEWNDGGQEDPGGEGMVPVARDAGLFYGCTLSRQRLRIFRMPPAATIKADVLKDRGTGNQVNAGLRPKATLAFLTALDVFSVFLSHKSQRIDMKVTVCLSVSAYSLVRLHDNLGFPLENRSRNSVSSCHAVFRCDVNAREVAGRTGLPSLHGRTYFAETGRTSPRPSS